MANWPTTLPQSPISDGYSATPQDNTIRSNKEAGPQKVRPRFTAVSDTVNMSVIVDAQQSDLLQQFYDVDCVFGALPFNWRNFKKWNKPPCIYRWRQPPEFVPLGGGFWRVALQLDRLP